ADEPAQHHEICQGEGRRPDADAEIDRRLFLDRCRSFDELEDQLLEKRTCRDQHRAADQCHDERPAEHGDQFGVVLCAERLSREPARAESQKAESPVEEAEDQRRNGDCADVIRLGQPSDHRRIDDADQRLGYVRQHDRYGDRQHMPVGDLRLNGRHVGEPRPEPRACDSGCQSCQGAAPWAVMDKMHLDAMLPSAFAAWFRARGWSPRRHQLAVIASIRQGRDTLLIAPTGGGKTLAGFLPSLIELASRPATGIHTLYVSPLKALAVDIARNLQTPVREMDLDVTIETRTGDTPAHKRRRQRSAPPDILITTPEQLALMIADAHAPRLFRSLRMVILDEL